MNRRHFLKTAALSLPVLSALPRQAFGEPAPAPAAGRTARPRKVIVIGAGLAGLAAAWELDQKGHEVTVLEAQMRPGGRVHTLREPFADGLYAEAGAISFSDSFAHFRRYVDIFKLPSAQLGGGPPKTAVYHLRGKRLTVKPGETPDWPYALAPDEKGLTPVDLVIKYLQEAETLGDPTDPAWRLSAFAKLDQVTLAEYLKKQGASSEAVALLGDTLWWGYGWSQGTALHRLVSDVAMFYMGQRAHVIPGGTDLLPKAFAAALREKIWYGVPVTKIEQEGDKVRVVFRKLGGEQALEADRVICTIPAPVLRNVEIRPELPAAKRRLLDQLEYTPVTRIYLQARRRFWADAGEAGGASTDLPIHLVTEHPFARREDAGPRGILECHAKGAAAEKMDGMDRAKQLAFATENLDKVHPGFSGFAEGGTSYSWGADPWARGGYPEWKPGQLTSGLADLARPEGRLHFAGEHTSVLSRTLEGALESGNRAAREIDTAES